MRLGMEVGPDDTLLVGDPAPAPTERTQQPSTFLTMSIVAKRSPISATAELLFILFDSLQLSRRPTTTSVDSMRRQSASPAASVASDDVPVTGRTRSSSAMTVRKPRKSKW